MKKVSDTLRVSNTDLESVRCEGETFSTLRTSRLSI